MRYLEKQPGSLVIALVHRQETMSLLGFLLLRYINVDDFEFSGPGPGAAGDAGTRGTRLPQPMTTELFAGAAG